MTDIVNGLLLRGREVLMAHRSPLRKNYPGSWSFPGGHVEHGETLEQALKRELSEEIGVLAQTYSFIRRFDDPAASADKPVTFHFFVVENWQGEPTNIGDEHTQIRWVTLDDAIQMQGLTFSAYIDLFETLMARTA
ncbi:MAG: NUDIX domain-containing protein [Maritimibacter sp.]